MSEFLKKMASNMQLNILNFLTNTIPVLFKFGMKCLLDNTDKVINICLLLPTLGSQEWGQNVTNFQKSFLEVVYTSVIETNCMVM
jgi:hypothetical protein